MARAAQELEEHGVNILSARSSVSGHHHATWNLIGEALPLRDEFEKRGWDFHHTDTEDTAVEVAGRLLAFLDELQQKIGKQRPDELKFLHRRFVSKQLMSFDEERMKNLWHDNQLWKRLGDQRSRAVTFSVVPVLTYLWRLGQTDLRHQDKGLEALKFQYDKATETLQGPARFSKDLRYLGIGSPGIAVASFDTDEHYLRLRFFKEDERRKLYHLDVDYSYVFDESKSSTSRSTKGLIARVTKSIADRKINLVQVSNSVSDQNTREESGGSVSSWSWPTNRLLPRSRS